MCRSQHRRAGLIALVAAAALTGCGGGGGGGGMGAGGPASQSKGEAKAGTAIDIKDFVYEPVTLRAKSGDKITVKNLDKAPHTVTAEDKSFDTGNLEKDQVMTFTAGKPGRYPYICTIHQYMKGTLEVS